MRYQSPLVLVIWAFTVASSFGQPPLFPPVSSPEPPLNGSPKPMSPSGGASPGQPGRNEPLGGSPPLGSQPPLGGGFPGNSAPSNPIPDLPLGTGGLGGFPGATQRPIGETGAPPLAKEGNDKGKGTGSKTSPLADQQPTYTPQDPAFPRVELRTRVQGVANPNEEVTYKLLLFNPTAGNAHKVQVRQTLPVQGRFIKATPTPSTQTDSELVWQLGTMQGGDQKEIQVVFKANGNGDLESTARVQFEYGQTVRTKMESALQMRMGPEATVNVMENETFSLTTELLNKGDTVLENVVLTQTIPDGFEFLNSRPAATGTNLLEWRFAKLEAGKSTAVHLDILAKKSGTFSTQARAVSGPQKKEQELTVKVGKAALELTGGGPDRRVVGRPATYYLTVVNRGTIPATNVKIKSLLSTAMEFLSADSGGKVVENNAHEKDIQWIIPSLAVGEKRTVSMVLRSIESKGIALRAEVTADRISDGIQLTKITKFYPANGLMVEVNKSVEPITVGDQTSFSVKLLNYASQTYKGTVVTITLPPEMQMLDASGLTGATKSDQKVVFAPIASLVPNQEPPAFTVYAKVIKTGEPRLRVEVRSPDLPGGELLFEEGIHFAAPSTSAPNAPNPAIPVNPGLSGGVGLPRFP